LLTACWTTSLTSSTLGSSDDGGTIHSIRSWPWPALISAALRAGMSALSMWSTVTRTPLSSPHFLAKPSNHLS
jgi:hypothetical protein